MSTTSKLDRFQDQLEAARRANGHVAPPQNLEAEQAVLGAVLLADAALGQIVDVGLLPEDFYREAYGLIYQAMLDLHALGEPVDALTLVEQLRQAGRLDRVGGRAAVDLLSASCPSLPSAPRYAAIVRDASHLRQIQAAALKVQQAGSLDDAAAHAEDLRALQAAHAGAADGDWLTGIGMDPTAEPLEPLPYIDGFPFMHAASSAIISGKTGGGRSYLMEACAYDAAKAGVRVLYAGSEITLPEFHARSADIAQRRQDDLSDPILRALLDENVRYLPLVDLLQAAWANPVAWRTQVPERYDVVILDPVSAIADALGLDFLKDNAEYTRFYNTLIQPLVTAGLAVLMPDNEGHAEEAQGRPMGVAQKGNVGDLRFACKTIRGAILITAKKTRSVRAGHGDGQTWRFHEHDRTITRDPAPNQPTTDGDWAPTFLMDRISKWVKEHADQATRVILNKVEGSKQHKPIALDTLVRHGYIEAYQDGQATRHRHLRDYHDGDPITDQKGHPEATS